MNLTGLQVFQRLTGLGIPAHALTEPSDALYRPALASWLTEDFHRWYFRALDAFGIRDYTAESGDCDDYADLFCVLARIAHRRTEGSTGTGLPLGRINVALAPNAPPGAQQRHALVWAMTSDKDVIFIEPQVLHRTERLSVPQLNSITRCDI